jgi:hypothetical protein
VDDDDGAKQLHLQMIQTVINRLANSSFLLKGWSVVLVSGLFALAAKDTKPLFVYIAYFPCTVFWALDGYFLWQERRYRRLYDAVRQVEPKNINYSMDTSQMTGTLLTAVFSKTLMLFHGAVVFTVIIVMTILLSR